LTGFNRNVSAQNLGQQEVVLAKNLRLGEILKHAGIIDDFQLNSALSYQRHWGGHFGESLIRLGYLTEDKLQNFLARQFDLPQVELSEPVKPVAKPVAQPMAKPESVARNDGLSATALKQLESRYENLVRILLDRGVINNKDQDELM